MIWFIEKVYYSKKLIKSKSMNFHSAVIFETKFIAHISVVQTMYFFVLIWLL